MAADDTYELDEIVMVAETDKAILVRHVDVEEEDAEDGEDQWWVPKSVITHNGLDRPGEEGYLEIETWWCEKNGIL